MSFAKVHLHLHLEGAVRFATLTELLPESAKVSGDLLADTKRHFCCAERESSAFDLVAFIAKFRATQLLLASTAVIERVAYECVVDQARDGVVLLEIRYSPAFIRDARDTERLSFDEIHAAVLRGVGRAQAQTGVEVGLIAILDRMASDAEAAHVMDFVLSKRADFVGVDLASDEVHGQHLFEREFARARAAGLGVTIHSAEVRDAHSGQRVIDAVLKQGATRIGHGIHVLDNAAAVALCVERQIHFEVSVSSNVLTNAVASVEQHPLPRMLAALSSVGLNTDDPGLFLCDLESEVRLVKSKLGITDAQLHQMQLNACRASFLPERVKARVERILLRSFGQQGE
jgi:adenosine deaminase